MASDVLRTGSSYDLDPQDQLRDDNDTPELAQQHATDLLNLQQGEYVLDTTFGIDWLAILQRRRVNVPAVVKDIENLLNTIPSITNLSLTGSQAGQPLSVSGSGRFARFRAAAEALIALTTSEQIGQNGAARFFWRIES